MAVKNFLWILFLVFSCLEIKSLAAEPASGFHQAPASVVQLKNPSSSEPAAIQKGAALFVTQCASCHGKDARGGGNVPSLRGQAVQSATAGEVFWFIGKGSVENGMPPSTLPKKQRWQIVAFVKSLGKASVAISAPVKEIPLSTKESGAAPPPPFTDYRFEKPGASHKILPQDLPVPMPASSVGNSPEVVPRPKEAWPVVPPGFAVKLYAAELENPRQIRTAPNGDIFLVESDSGKIKVFRGLTPDGKPQQNAVFASGLKRPYGIAFYPPGKNPRWIYIGNTDAVVKFPYRNGDLKARGDFEKIIDLPSGRGHWTRDLQFSLDGKKLFVAVGSASNVDDPDTTLAEKNRAAIWVMTPDGKNQQIYASGIRNAGAGLVVHPQSGELWASVNERDGLGDNLVPDYITRVQEGGFYGWPWWYMGGFQDPRHPGKHPELKKKLLQPDVLLQPHHASLGMVFYEGTQFPSEYRGDLFSAQHGSWNRSVRTGYELIRVPLHQTGKATGEYEDFMTGFVVDSDHVWGRPVSVTVATDGSLLVTDDGSNSIWRITYAVKK